MLFRECQVTREGETEIQKVIHRNLKTRWLRQTATPLPLQCLFHRVVSLVKPWVIYCPGPEKGSRQLKKGIREKNRQAEKCKIEVVERWNFAWHGQGYLANPELNKNITIEELATKIIAPAVMTAYRMRYWNSLLYINFSSLFSIQVLFCLYGIFAPFIRNLHPIRLYP